ncbi:MAG: NAD(P)H-dependent oxidoreductase [Sphingomonadales bacterium]|nr:NAD(P)H-dependent oxidoreductase [Sphingomonadales bacterium]
MVTIAAIAGSLRSGSYNRALLRAAHRVAPPGVTLIDCPIDAIPLYNGDLETAQGIPAAVTALKDRIAEADGLLIVTPEYNNSIPGVLKNAIDWASRPAADISRVFGGKPVAVIGASPGGFGTILSQNAWLPVLRTLGAELWSEGRLMVSRVAGLIDDQGDIADPATLGLVAQYVAGFAAHLRERA